eukprot:8864095-Alexandrium_andersonii.AAC.1
MLAGIMRTWAWPGRPTRFLCDVKKGALGNTHAELSEFAHRRRCVQQAWLLCALGDVHLARRARVPL